MPFEIIIPLVVVFGYFGIYALWSNELEGQRLRKMERSANWPFVQGVVKETVVKGMSVRVIYEYLAQGHVYKDTDKITFPQAMVVRWQAQALGSKVKKEIADYPPGQHVVIRYNPQEPGESVLYYRGELHKGDSSGNTGAPPQFALLP